MWTYLKILFRRGFNSHLLHLSSIVNKYNLIIKDIRLIDEKGQQLGIFSLEKASQIAQEKGFDLVLVTKKTEPPIYKLGDYGKSKYHHEKELKKRKLQGKQVTPKSIQIGFNEGEHDLEVKIKKIEKFLNQGRAVNIDMKLRGRQKAHFNLAKEKMNNFCQKITIEYKIIQPLKKVPRGIMIVLKK